MDCQIYYPELELKAKYKVVEYIQSSGTQYIDTGYIPLAEYCKLDISFIATSIDGGVFGASNISSSSQYNFANYLASGTFRLYCGSGGYTSVSISTGTKYNFICEANNGTQTISDSTGILSTKTYSGNLRQTGSYTIPLFARRESSYYTSSAKIYFAKFYEQNNTLVRNYIPVLKISDNSYGLYDRVNEKFYANSGSGSFTGGAETGEVIYG